MESGRWTAARYMFGGPSLRALTVALSGIVVVLAGLGVKAALTDNGPATAHANGPSAASWCPAYLAKTDWLGYQGLLDQGLDLQVARRITHTATVGDKVSATHAASALRRRGYRVELNGPEAAPGLSISRTRLVTRQELVAERSAVASIVRGAGGCYMGWYVAGSR